MLNLIVTTPSSPPISTPSNPAAAAACAGVIVAGGTALQLGWGQTAPTDPLIDISRMAVARGITEIAGTLRVGALETLETCRTNPLIRRHAPLLAEACETIAALGVRTLATLGGNIGWRQGDSIPALLALGAQVECLDGVSPLADILTAPAMPLLLAVHLPPLPRHAVTIFEKTGHRAAFSLSIVTVAGYLDRTPSGSIRHARLAVCGANLPARRLPIAEAMLLCETPDWPAIAASVAAETGGDRGAIAGRVLTGRLRAALTS